MNTLNTQPYAGLNNRYCNPPQADGRVPEDLLSVLDEHGMTSPIRGITDPRLQYPEMLLMMGWQRQVTDTGISYTCETEDTSKSMPFLQTYVAGFDNTRTLTTRTGHSQHVVTMDCTGKVTTRLQNV